jgi:hypothetical protein
VPARQPAFKSAAQTDQADQITRSCDPVVWAVQHTRLAQHTGTSPLGMRSSANSTFHSHHTCAASCTTPRWPLTRGRFGSTAQAGRQAGRQAGWQAARPSACKRSRDFDEARPAARAAVSV